jgi:hypothetical protein
MNVPECLSNGSLQYVTEFLTTLLYGSRRHFRTVAPPFSSDESSSRRESHPPALTEPDVNLSAHPALAGRLELGGESRQ